MAAGHAVGVWSLAMEDLTAITTDTFSPSISEDGKSLLQESTRGLSDMHLEL